ncbi:glycoside hydrolase family 28 protein [Paludibacter jiangxiensis]|uniref:Pectate lyase superfamily protein n=1 Tax=Paludibacter jiangxiensis TaxID=681398 RepID=A0A170Z077_9BACT|nr:pectate lyase superfamily protein [Paludibacter jiangxiensis]
MKKLLTICLLALSVQWAVAEVVDMQKAGAVADGKTLNTAVIKKTIDRLSAHGGGTLFFPAGTYLTGPIVLKSNITIDIESGATIQFSTNYDDYLPFVEMRYEGVVMKSFSPLFYAYGQENITIKGRGKIDGNGQAWWNAVWALEGAKKDEALAARVQKYRALWDKENPDFQIEANSDWKGTLAKKFFRPSFIQFYKSKDIRIEGITLVNSPFWTVNPEFCENVTVDGITINNPYSPNTDGINPSSCKNVHIANCHISVGDDCITIKSGRDAQGRKYGVPCENVTVTNCTMLAGHGGVVIGSEMSGSVRKVTISNCVFDGTDRGIRIKSVRGRGGYVEEVRVNNIVMKDIKKEAIVLSLFYGKAPLEPLSERTPIFRNIHISGMTGSNVNAACLVEGIEEMPVSDVSFEDINMDAQSGFDISRAKDIRLSNVKVNAQMGAAFKLSDVSNAYLSNVSTLKPIADKSVIEATNVSDLFITGCFPQAGSRSFLSLNGEKSNNIILSGNYLIRVTNPVERQEDLNKNVVIVEK